MSAIGVLVGGVLTGRTSRHGLVAAVGLAVTGAVAAFIGLVDPGAAAGAGRRLSGFSSGLAMPSRDMIVRSVTPPGAFGRVFGFVTTGFIIAGIVSPIIFGQLLDHGHPRAVFIFIAACAVVAVAHGLVRIVAPANGVIARRTALQPVVL